MSADPACRAPVPPEGAVPRTCVPFAHVPAVPVVAVPYVPVPVPSGLPVLSVAGILPDRTGNVDVTRFLEEWAAGPLADKADKAVPLAAGSLAALDASGNLADSGKSPSDFAPASHASDGSVHHTAAEIGRIAAGKVAEVVDGAPEALDTLKEIADVIGTESGQAAGGILKRVSALEAGKADSSSLAAVATSGSYDDLSGKPTVPAVDAALATRGAAADAEAVGDAITPLQMAAWYPDGSVKSRSEWTPKWDGTTGLKYEESSRDVVNKTIFVCLFSINSKQSVENNSHLAGRVVIPPYVDVGGERYTVTGIGHTGSMGTGAAADNGSLVSVVAPTTVKRVYGYSFCRCTSLTDVSIPAATTILVGAFMGCTSLLSASFPAASRVPQEVFFGCTSLKAALFPVASTVETDAFLGCSSLVSVTLRVSEIGRGVSVFHLCQSLEYVCLPEITSIAGGFGSCPSLAAVDFGATPRPSVPTLATVATFASVPYTCVFVVPDAQYDAWVSAPAWSTLRSRGHRFLKHSEWEHARKYEIPYALVFKAPVSGTVSLSDRAVNLVNPTVTELPPVWEWSDGLDHGQPVYGVVYDDGGGYQEYAWGFQGEGDAPSGTDSFGHNYSLVYDGPDATELSFYNNDTYETIVASLVTRYETDVSSLSLPPAVAGKVRDFMVRLAMPENATMFSWPSSVEYETEDGQMPDVSEPGVYLLAFTETGAGRFALLCRKVQGVA